jgi:hypothetical protein
MKRKEIFLVGKCFLFHLCVFFPKLSFVTHKLKVKITITNKKNLILRHLSRNMYIYLCRTYI